MGARIGSRLTLDQGAKLGVGANARNAANSADGHRSYALADTESDSHKEETISENSASLHVGLIRVGCFLLWSVWEPTPAEPALARVRGIFFLKKRSTFFYWGFCQKKSNKKRCPCLTMFVKKKNPKKNFVITITITYLSSYSSSYFSISY